MAFLQTAVETVKDNVGVQLLLALFLFFAYPIGAAIYNLYFHPLAGRFPGPKLWAASRLPFVHALLTGRLVQRQREIHEKYGDVVRLAPDEVSFSNEESWDDIYSFRRGHKRAVRDKAFFSAPNDDVDNIITTTDPKFHMRVRGLLSNSFTEDSLRSFHPLIHRHADVLVDQLASISAKSPTGKGTVNMTDWLNFFTMDVIGDLAFGEPFGCLERGDYHDWVRTLFMYLKFMSLAAAPRYWPLLEAVLKRLMPASIMEGQRRHESYANERINKRLNSAASRPDFMAAFQKKMAGPHSMSHREIASTFNFVIVGGSETSATVLTGLFCHISRDERVRRRLCEEIRARFEGEEGITIDKVQGLPYLEAVLNEGLRMCNPIPCGLPRVVPPGGDTYCGVYLPGGTRLGTRTFAINRSPRYFHNADRFVPERWLPLGERPAEYADDKLSASRPFSVGFHSCLGKPLAWIELRLVMCRLLWKFDFAAMPGEEASFDDFPIIMLVQKGPVKVSVQVRKDLKQEAA
ncbi:cytochrome P450 [Corynespora cassiicola Philippines]|uniref:Cytochrome P450 n=1 Tax=Corynespora cassiicola Philippines TaxID=1448308 RepID=A0A2T2N7M7_CORCC|nr:cytochrome P450 [Corynespora cassiicola Philippines]